MDRGAVLKDRRAWVVAGVVAVVLVIVVGLLVGDGEEEGPEAVGTQGLPGFPARGELVQETEVVQAAGDAWRDQATEDLGDDEVQVLYADVVDGERLNRSGDEKDVEHQVVALATRSRVAVVHRPEGAEWDLLDEARLPVETRSDPLLAVGGGLHLASTQLVDEVDVVSLPAPWESTSEPDEQREQEQEQEQDQDGPEVVTADFAEDPLLVVSSASVVRIPPESGAAPEGSLVWLGTGSSNPASAVFNVSTDVPEGTTLDDEWDSLLDPDVAPAATALFGTLTDSLNSDDANDAPSALEQRRNALTWTLLGDRTVPDGPDPDLRIVGAALGLGGSGSPTSEVVGVALDRAESRVVRTISETSQERPVAGAWVEAEFGERWYLVYAADPGLGLELRLGGRTATPDAGVGVVAPRVREEHGPGSPVLLFGEDGDGVAHPAPPVESTVR